MRARTKTRAAIVALGTVVAAGAVARLAPGGPAPPPPEAYVEPDVRIPDATIRFFEAKLEADPENFAAARKLVGSYRSRFQRTARMSDVDRAEQLARAYLHVDPDPAGARARLASVLLARHAFGDAVESAEAAVAAAPGDPGAWSALFDAAFAAGRYDRAEVALTRLEPGGVPRQVKSALWLSARGRHDAASGRMTRACRRIESWSRPEVEAWCWTELAKIERLRSGPRAAAALYDHALARSPGYRGAIEGRAGIAQDRGEWAVAERLYRRVATDAHADLYLRLAEVRRARGDAPSARRWERRFLAVAGTPEGEALFAQPLSRLLASRDATVDRAVAVAEREVARRPTTEAWDALAWARYRAGDVAGARAAVDRAEEWGAPSPDAGTRRETIRSAAPAPGSARAGV